MENETNDPGNTEINPGFAKEMIRQAKEFRVALDGVLQLMKARPSSRECALAITKTQEAIMWLGMELKRLGTDNPYPNSYKPENTVVDPTADGLKL